MNLQSKAKNKWFDSLSNSCNICRESLLRNGDRIGDYLIVRDKNASNYYKKKLNCGFLQSHQGSKGKVGERGIKGESGGLVGSYFFHFHTNNIINHASYSMWLGFIIKCKLLLFSHI